MGKPRHPHRNWLEPSNLWSPRPRTKTAKRDLDEILGSVAGLPLSYWRERMFFRGLPDELAFQLTGGLFPARRSQGAHPVFSLKALPEAAGFRVCPCSSKSPFREKNFRYIRKGCRLLHTNHTMDRPSYLIDKIQLNIPRSVAPHLRFMGEVPEECIKDERKK